MLLQIVSAVLMVLSVVGAVLNSYKRVEGFYLWIVTNIGWIAVDLVVGLPFQAMLFLVYTVISINGIVQWRKKGES